MAETPRRQVTGEPEVADGVGVPPRRIGRLRGGAPGGEGRVVRRVRREDLAAAPGVVCPGGKLKVDEPGTARDSSRGHRGRGGEAGIGEHDPGRAVQMSSPVLDVAPQHLHGGLPCDGIRWPADGGQGVEEAVVVETGEAARAGRRLLRLMHGGHDVGWRCEGRIEAGEARSEMQLVVGFERHLPGLVQQFPEDDN
jgi:hypothetical protein